MKIKELKKLKELKLSDTEKKDLFNRISASIRESGGDVKFNYPIPSPFFRFTYIFESRFVKAGLMAMFILSLSGATAFASLNTLPGDLLYGVKTKVVEKIPSLLAVSPESKAKYNTKKIEKRVEEFEKLAEKGRLTKEHTEKLEKDINKNLGDFDKNIKEIKNKKKEKKEEEKKDDSEEVYSSLMQEPETETEEDEILELEEELESKLREHSEKIEKIREEDGAGPATEALESVLERARSRNY